MCHGSENICEISLTDFNRYVRIAKRWVRLCHRLLWIPRTWFNFWTTWCTAGSNIKLQARLVLDRYLTNMGQSRLSCIPEGHLGGRCCDTTKQVCCDAVMQGYPLKVARHPTPPTKQHLAVLFSWVLFRIFNFLGGIWLYLFIFCLFRLRVRTQM